MKFLSSVVEQLDLALEHIAKDDLHNARFGLMLTDNALELVLHQIAKDKQRDAASYRYGREPYPYRKQLKAALLRRFDEKLTFARLDGGLQQEEAQTFKILHDYRNDLYHAGLTHEQILHALTHFYFSSACKFIGRYSSHGLSWGSALKMPARAKKYFQDRHGVPGTQAEFRAACASMASSCGHADAVLVSLLADQLDRIVGHADICVKIVADGVYEGDKRTRDRAVIETLAWEKAFDGIGAAFVKEQGWRGSTMGELIAYLAANYPFKTRGDPIAGWQRQAAKLRRQTNPNLALQHFQTFTDQTAELRTALEQSAGAAEAEIDAHIDRMREARHRD